MTISAHTLNDASLMLYNRPFAELDAYKQAELRKELEEGSGTISTMDHDFFGPPIHSYSRAEAIHDGVLADLSSLFVDGKAVPAISGIRHPVAVTRSVWYHCILGKSDLANRVGIGQMTMAACAFCELLADKMRGVGTSPTDRVYFEAPDLLAAGIRDSSVELWAKVGPGDTLAPVITVMLRSED